jgi:hypothetical protein
VTVLQKVNEQEPWYHNPWVWLLIAIPSLTVIGCMFTMYLALTNPHILVSDAPAEYRATTESKDSGAE